MDADYSADITLLANTPTKACYIVWGRCEVALASMSMQKNPKKQTKKPEYVRFNKKGDIFTRNRSYLKGVFDVANPALADTSSSAWEFSPTFNSSALLVNPIQLPPFATLCILIRMAVF